MEISLTKAIKLSERSDSLANLYASTSVKNQFGDLPEISHLQSLIDEASRVNAAQASIAHLYSSASVVNQLGNLKGTSAFKALAEGINQTSAVSASLADLYASTSIGNQHSDLLKAAPYKSLIEEASQMSAAQASIADLYSSANIVNRLGDINSASALKALTERIGQTSAVSASLADLYASTSIGNQYSDLLKASIADLAKITSPLAGLLEAPLFKPFVAEAKIYVDTPSRPIINRVPSHQEFCRLLSALNQKFLTVWAGAQYAASSQNPDKVRHVVISIRTIAEQALHILAPTQLVEACVSKDERNFQNGKLTRFARVSYVIALSNNPSLRPDCDKVLNIFRKLNECAHGIGRDISDDELFELITDAADTLSALIRCQPTNLS